jgi:hypothetical protein
MQYRRDLNGLLFRQRQFRPARQTAMRRAALLKMNCNNDVCGDRKGSEIR